MKKEFVMAEYKNMMENLVEDEYGRAASSLGCSTCDICRSDIIAYALNLLPPKYVVTRAGEVYSKTFMLRNQHRTDIMAALARGADVVRKNPRH